MRLSSIDLNLLLVLHTVLVERHVARAAARLRVTPSAVSNSLARLRVMLDDPLVVRKGRGIVPTPRANAIAPSLARALEAIEETLAAEPFDPARCTRLFTLAVADAGQVTYVPRIAAEMRRRFPNAHLRVIGIDSLLTLGDLASAEVDLHLGVPAKGPGLHGDGLFDERTVLAVRRLHPFRKKRLTKAALAELRHVRVDMLPGRSQRDPIALAYEKASVPRTIALTVPTFAAAAAAVVASDLVATLPANFVAHIAPLGIRELRVSFATPVVPIALSWHDRTHADAAAVAFRALVKEAALAAVGLPSPPR